MTAIATSRIEAQYEPLSAGGTGADTSCGTGNSPHYFRVGVIDIAITSELPGVLSEYTELYHQCRIPRSDRAINLSVHRERSRYTLGRRYVIRGDGERMFSVRKLEEVLPHLEWAVNWRIVKEFHSYLQLHSGVVQRNGAGFVFPASPGSGKTTLCCGLLARGWKYLSDEFALIDPQGNLHPYPKALCVKEGSFSVVEGLSLPQLSPYQYKKGAKGRVAYLSPSDIGPQCVSDVCPLRYVVFPTYREGAEPSLQRITRGEAAFQVTQLSFNFQKYGPEAMGLLTNAIRSADCYRLTSGEINKTCDLMERLANGELS